MDNGTVLDLAFFPSNIQPTMKNTWNRCGSLVGMTMTMLKKTANGSLKGYASLFIF
jgi:hypothetical protein